jgi:hypothetical protein
MEMVLLLHLIKPRTSKQLLGNKSNYLHHPLIPSVLQGQLRKMNLLIVQVRQSLPNHALLLKKASHLQQSQYQLRTHNMVLHQIK